MGLQGDDGEVLSGDPIPAAPGQVTTGGNFFTGDGNSAIVGEDSNLWDSLIVDPETVYVQEPTPEPEVLIAPVTEPTVEEPTVEPINNGVAVDRTNTIGADVIVEPTPTPTPTPTSTPSTTPSTTPTTSTTTPTTPVFVEEPATVVTNIEEKPRNTIFETKIVEIMEYDNVTPVALPEKEEDESNRSMMIIIVAAIIGVLLLVIVAMVVRVGYNKRQMSQVPVAKTEPGVIDVDVEP